MYRHLMGLFIAILVFTDASGAIAGQAFTLGSGKKIEVLSIKPLRTRNGSQLLTLRYKTPTPLKHAETLTREINELWEHFIVDVERDGFKGAIITAVKSGKSRKFVIKMKDGTWRLPELEKPKMLTRESVRTFYNRLTWLGEQSALNSSLLYVHNDWFVAFVGKVIGPEPIVINLAQYLSLVRLDLPKVRDRRVREKIMKIVILKGGKSARIKSRVTDSGFCMGRYVEADTIVTSFVELRGGTIMLNKSVVVIKKYNTSTPL